jgi:hypothetical protein
MVVITLISLGKIPIVVLRQIHQKQQLLMQLLIIAEIILLRQKIQQVVQVKIR